MNLKQIIADNPHVDPWPDSVKSQIKHMRMPGSPCQWTQNEDGAWDTNCRERFEFTAGDPVENKFRHCPYCGGQLSGISG